MLFDFVGVLILVVLIALFGFLLWRAWGSKRAWLKWLGTVLAGLLTLLLTLALVAVLYGFFKLNATQSNPVSNLKAGGTPEQIAKAGRWVNLCSGCHSTALKPPLDGGKDNFGVDPAGGPPLGTIYPPNLTPAGPLKDWTDGEIVRAIREGVHKNGRSLIFMPSEVFHNMSDADVQSVVAYLRSQPPVQHDLPDVNLSVVAAFFVAIGAPLQANQTPITQPIVAPPSGVTLEYGKYLVSIMGCQSCHGQDLAGGAGGFGPPPGPNLTVVIPKWSEADFIKALRTGTDPAGKELNSELMPWKEYNAALTNDEFKAMFQFLKGLKLIDKSVK